MTDTCQKSVDAAKPDRLDSIETATQSDKTGIPAIMDIWISVQLKDIF